MTSTPRTQVTTTTANRLWLGSASVRLSSCMLLLGFLCVSVPAVRRAENLAVNQIPSTSSKPRS